MRKNNLDFEEELKKIEAASKAIDDKEKFFEDFLEKTCHLHNLNVDQVRTLFDNFIFNHLAIAKSHSKYEQDSAFISSTYQVCQICQKQNCTDH